MTEYFRRSDACTRRFSFLHSLSVIFRIFSVVYCRDSAQITPRRPRTAVDGEQERVLRPCYNDQSLNCSESLRLQEPGGPIVKTDIGRPEMDWAHEEKPRGAQNRWALSSPSLSGLRSGPPRAQ